jgi:myo-inositol-1(or 4)-monophosphatase
MKAYLQTARAAARAAGELIRSRFPQVGVDDPLHIQHKGRIDLVTEVDLASEKLLREVIARDWPAHGILGEEEGQVGATSAPLWIVDPLDGTRSFAHGYPFVCVSIGLEIDGELQVGVVYDPIRDELFEASLGGGAFLNGRPIQVSRTPRLEQALLVTGFPYHLADIDNTDLFGLFREMVVQSGGIRRDGSAALDFCYIACGRLDGYWEFFLKPWDGAAGALIASEAGARVTTMTGEPFRVRYPELIASNALIHDEMLAISRRYCESMRCYY